MKLITEFLYDNNIKFTTDDDKHNFYLLICRLEDRMYSLWYNAEFVWEKHYSSTGVAVANVVAALVDAMEIKE